MYLPTPRDMQGDNDTLTPYGRALLGQASYRVWPLWQQILQNLVIVMACHAYRQLGLISTLYLMSKVGAGVGITLVLDALWSWVEWNDGSWSGSMQKDENDCIQYNLICIQ